MYPMKYIRHIKKQINHEAHLNKSDKKYKVYGYEDYKVDLDSIVDEDVDIEKIIETKMRIEDLAKAIGKLNDKEQKLIHAIYFEGKTLKDIAKKHDTNLMRISRIRDKILRKLRQMLDR